MRPSGIPPPRRNQSVSTTRNSRMGPFSGFTVIREKQLVDAVRANPCSPRQTDSGGVGGFRLASCVISAIWGDLFLKKGQQTRGFSGVSGARKMHFPLTLLRAPPSIFLRLSVDVDVVVAVSASLALSIGPHHCVVENSLKQLGLVLIQSRTLRETKRRLSLVT